MYNSEEDWEVINSYSTSSSLVATSAYHSNPFYTEEAFTLSHASYNKKKSKKESIDIFEDRLDRLIKVKKFGGIKPEGMSKRVWKAHKNFEKLKNK